jgi:hypothetical protein
VTYSRRRCSQEVHGSDASVEFGDGQVVDGVPYDEGIPMVSAAFTSACRSDDGKRLEELWRRRPSGLERIHRFAAK